MWTSPENMPLRIGNSGARHMVQPNGGLIIHSLSSVDTGEYVCSLIVDDRIVRNSTVYVSIEDCSMAPCMNGGECEDLDGKGESKMFCRCLEPYEGRYCETKKNMWLLLIPFIGSGLVVLAIIAIIVKFTCLKKRKTTLDVVPLTTTVSPTTMEVQKEILVKPKKLNFSNLNLPHQGVRQSQSQLRSSVVQPVQLRTTPSGSLPRYDVTAQYGDPAYWPDRRFSYTKFQDGVVTQTGRLEDYEPAPVLQGPQWGYAAAETQTASEFAAQNGSISQPLPFVATNWNEQDLTGPNEEYRTNLPGSLHEFSTERFAQSEPNTYPAAYGRHSISELHPVTLENSLESQLGYQNNTWY
jgi:hypothetical protein